MAKIKDWREEIEILDNDKLLNLLNSLEELYSWDFFNKEYKWTGLFSVKEMINNELIRRGI